MLRKHSDIRSACELHTHNLWQSLADANVYTDGHSYGNCYRHSYGNCDSRESHADGDRYGYGYCATA